MSDGTVFSIKPTMAVQEVLMAHEAIWSINDTEGFRTTTKVHARGRKVSTPLTGAKCVIQCFPQGQPILPKGLSYGITFYPPASLVGNNIFPGNFVRVPTIAALACWKKYMHLKYPKVPLAVLEAVKLDDCILQEVTFVYLWLCETPEAAKVLHNRLYKHLKACLDGSTRYRPRGAGRARIPRKKARVRTDADLGDTFYADTSFGQARVYIKTDESPKTFCDLADREVLAKMYEKSAHVVRFEIEVDIGKIRYGADGDQAFSRNPAMWTTQFMPDDPAEIIWNEVRKEFSLNDSLAKHEPDADRVAALPSTYQVVLQEHLRGNADLLALVQDNKQLSRIGKRLMKDFKVNLNLPWVLQKKRTWSSWLAQRMRYSKRLSPSDLGEFTPHCLTAKSVLELTKELQLSFLGPTAVR